MKLTICRYFWSLYMFVFIQKQYSENFAFLPLRILELFACEVWKFSKKQANFYLILLFLDACKQTFHISYVRISQNLKGVLMWISSTYFHVKTKILADFQIYISVPLMYNHFSFLLLLLLYYYCIIIIIITIIKPLLVVAIIVVAVAVLAVVVSSLLLSVVVALIIYQN